MYCKSDTVATPNTKSCVLLIEEGGLCTSGEKCQQGLTCTNKDGLGDKCWKLFSLASGDQNQGDPGLCKSGVRANSLCIESPSVIYDGSSTTSGVCTPDDSKQCSYTDSSSNTATIEGFFLGNGVNHECSCRSGTTGQCPQFGDAKYVELYTTYSALIQPYLGTCSKSVEFSPSMWPGCAKEGFLMTDWQTFMDRFYPLKYFQFESDSTTDLCVQQFSLDYRANLEKVSVRLSKGTLNRISLGALVVLIVMYQIFQ